MKKPNLLILFLIGGCIGITLVQISYVITNLFMGQIDSQTIAFIKNLFWSFICGGLCFCIAVFSIKNIENKDVKSKERQKILKTQIKWALVFVVYFAIFFIINIIKKNTIGMLLAFSFIVVFAIWGYGYMLAYINLKNSMSMIQTKK